MPNFKITPDIVLTVGDPADLGPGDDPSCLLTALLTVHSGKDHDLTLEDLRALVEAGTNALRILEARAASRS